VCRPKHVEQLRNSGIINSTTQSHIVDSFYEIYFTMHGSMNIKLSWIPAFREKWEMYVQVHEIRLSRKSGTRC
jgi:hypothetical protein